jgi:hypothetical protein
MAQDEVTLQYCNLPQGHSGAHININTLMKWANESEIAADAD